MMYTRERLMKAVREAGSSGQPFTLGEVRAKLGIKSQDKREQKRFRSRFRECCQILGDGLEKLGPNTFRLKGVQPSAAAPAPVQLRALKAVPLKQPAQPASANLRDRVGVQPAPAHRTAQATPADPWEADALKRRPREAHSFVTAEASNHPQAARSPSFGERLSSWFGRTRTHNSSAAATALSRLAVDLQPKAAGFEYRWIDGKLQVQRAADK